MRTTLFATMVAATFVQATPLSAEIVETGDGHFVTRDEAVVEATPKEVWLALISPARWWNSAHTWSADAANLKLTPQAGGCFCETIPEVDEPDRFTLEGSVEHMRVIQAYPEQALRMVGALGPLQSEPVTGILTIAISEVDEGTKIVWEYNVGGPMRYEMPVISKAVDGVMTQQLDGLADLLGRVDAPEDEAESEPQPDTDAGPGEDEPGSDDPDGAAIEPEAVIEEESADSGPSVDEAFEDLSADGPD